MPSFEIPDSPANVKLQSGPPGAKAPRTGSIVFNVTNKAAAPVAGRLSIQTAGQAKADWFVVDGEKERTFAPGETQTVAVKIAAPPEAPPGDYSFRLRIVAVNDPDNDHTAGPASVARVEGAGTIKPPPPVWPFIVAAIVVLLIIGGAAAWYFLHNSGEVADNGVVAESNESMPVDDVVAVPSLTRLLLKDARPLATGFVLKENRVDPTGEAPGMIIDQTPAKDTPAKKGDQINVYFDPGVRVPPLRALTVPQAVNKLSSADFRNEVVTTCGTAEPDQVEKTSPAANEYAAKGSVVKVYVVVKKVASTGGGGPYNIARACLERKLSSGMLSRVAAGQKISTIVTQLGDQ